MKLSLILILLSCILVGCDPASNKLLIKNESESGIYAFYFCDQKIDSLILKVDNENEVLSSDILPLKYIYSKSSERFIRRGFNAWDGYVKDCPDRILHIFIITDSSAIKYMNGKIRFNNLIDETIIINYKDLIRSNWTVVYNNYR